MNSFLCLVPLVNTSSKCGNVVPSVRFSGYVKIVLDKLRMRCKERLQEVVQVSADTLLVMSNVVLIRRVTKTGSSRLVDEDEIRRLVPTVIVPHEGQVVGDVERAILIEQCQFTATTRPSG